MDLSPLSEARLSHLMEILRLHCPRAFLPLPLPLPLPSSNDSSDPDPDSPADLDSFLDRPPSPLQQLGQVSAAAAEDDRQVRKRT